jgi:ABC-type enterochelin transport system ATPase subunit
VLNEKYITRLAKQSSKGVSLILTRISSEIYQNYITSFYTNQSIWDIALIGLKCRIFKKENGQFPDRLDQLNIQQINKDPFNKFRPYKLKRIEQDIITLGMV